MTVYFYEFEFEFETTVNEVLKDILTEKSRFYPLKYKNFERIF